MSERIKYPEELTRRALDVNEIYNGKVNLVEVDAKLFADWFKWRMDYEPVLLDTGLKLADFDIESVLTFFSDWIIECHENTIPI